MIKKNLKKLKKIIKLNNVDGYIIPKNDEYFSEFSFPNRLKTISNFSGSAGFALILKKKNYLFVDGRYTLQAKIQSGNNFQILEIPKIWPKEVLYKFKKKLHIGFDPKLFTNLTLYRYFDNTCKLTPLKQNLIDLIFQEKKQKNISIKTKERVLSAEVVGKQNVEINMGKPKFGWEEVPLSESMNTKQVNIDLLEKEHGNGFCLNVGNPHIIFFVKDCSKIDIKKLGPKIENYKFFPERINVTFAQVLDKKNIKVNVWERGAGQTKACGTAACAVTVAASIKGLTDKSLQIHFKEGNLQIDYKKEVFMAGPVSEVKKIDLEI